MPKKDPSESEPSSIGIDLEQLGVEANTTQKLAEHSLLKTDKDMNNTIARMAHRADVLAHYAQVAQAKLTSHNQVTLKTSEENAIANAAKNLQQCEMDMSKCI